MNQARQSLENCSRDLQNAQSKMEEKAEYLESSLGENSQEYFENIGKRIDNLSNEFNRERYQFLARAENLENSIQKQNQEVHEMLEAKLSNKFQQIKDFQDHLSEKADLLEACVADGNKNHEMLEAKLSHLSQEIITISNKLLFVMDQNEASSKKILALQGTIEELSCGFQGFASIIKGNSEDMQNLRTTVIESNGTLSSLKNHFEERRCGLVHRFRSAIHL